jgi:hypothetical protein
MPPTAKRMNTPWDTELAAYLQDLSAVQDKTLDVLARKRQMLMEADAEGLAAVGEEEARLVESLQACLDRREELLARARREGLPGDSLRSLSAGLPGPAKNDLSYQVRLASHRARLLQHHSLTNWVLVQKTLIHLSQLLEIIATGGRLQPTYGKDEPVHASGALVDREV